METGIFAEQCAMHGYCRSSSFAALALTCLAAWPCTAEPPQPAPRAAPSAEQVAGWIRTLDADEFLDRETAMLQLLEAGPAVLPALRPVLTGGTLEATSRAFFVVRQLGLSASDDAQDQAAELLADLSARNEAPALARRASAALAELMQQRSGQALAELEALGAKVSRSQVAGGFNIDDPVLSVELGDAFQGTEHDLRRLKWVVEAPRLILNGKQVTNGWLAHAAKMPGLEELHIYQAAISDEGLAPLAQIATLRQFGLYYTPVGEVALSPLGKLPLLSFVKLYGTRVSEEAVDKFKAASAVAVDCRRGAFLGVSCEDPEICRIRTVHADSPAAKGGLVPGDILVRFAGQPVKNFDALTDLIRKCDIGDEVEVGVARQLLDDQGQSTLRSVTAKLKFSPWDVESAVRNGRR
jgi:PDZ domain